MHPVEVLKSEHRLIEQVLDLLEAMLIRGQEGRTPPEGILTWITDFLQQFSDRCHHAKEEELLFPLLEAHGVPREGGPVGCMLHEHTQGREFVIRMKQGIGPDGTPSDDSLSAAASFITLLREHILKEDNILFEMARQHIPDAEAESLLEQFADVTEERQFAKLRTRFETELGQWQKQLC
ncbi:MAG: hemerythrin [Planctomycetaceae bacterium]|nr:hemerythrin [Planctomycetaceae bacterium]